MVFATVASFGVASHPSASAIQVTETSTGVSGGSPAASLSGVDPPL